MSTPVVFLADIKEAIVERIAIKDEISKSSSYNRGSLSKISQGFRDIHDFILSLGSVDRGGEPGNYNHISVLDSAATLQRMKDDLDLQIRLYEVEMKKLYRMACATESEITYYQHLNESLTESILAVKNSLKENDERREQNLVKSKNLQEYESLAKLCLELPSQRETKIKIKLIQQEMDALQKEELEILNDFRVRERRINILLDSFHELKSGYDDDIVMQDAPTQL